METPHAASDRDPATDIAPSLGLVLAGVALAAAFLPWTGSGPFVAADLVTGSAVGAGLALVAVLAFSTRRHGGTGRRVGAGVAAVASIGIVALAVARLVTPALGTADAVSSGGSPSVTVGLGLPIAAVAAFLCTAMAVADFRGLPDGEVWRKLRATVLATAIGLLGFVISSLVAAVPGLAARAFGTTAAVAALTAGSGIGLGLFAVGYLTVRDLGWDYIDLGWPDLQAVAYSIGGLVVLFVSAAAVSFAFTSLGLPTAESSIQDLAEGMENPEFLLVLVPLSFLAIGPGEELVYRNVVQKYLYETFPRSTAVVVASVVFAAVHFQQYANTNPVAVLSTLFLVFVLSLVLGYSYYKTENLLVPIFIHGAFNALQFAALYVQLTSDVAVA